jgi:hypothetical protein
MEVLITKVILYIKLYHKKFSPKFQRLEDSVWSRINLL